MPLLFADVLVFSANGAASYQPGAKPQENMKQDRWLKARPIVPVNNRIPSAMNRAFSALDYEQPISCGVAPGWYGAAPLALLIPNRKRDSTEILSRIHTTLNLKGRTSKVVRSLTVLTEQEVH
jgi:hypothetical protein